MRYLNVLGWAVVFTVTTLLFACATNDARMSHSDPIIGPDVTMAQLTEEDSQINRGMEPTPRVIMLPATRDQVVEREKMLYFLEGDLDGRRRSQRLVGRRIHFQGLVDEDHSGQFLLLGVDDVHVELHLSRRRAGEADKRRRQRAKGFERLEQFHGLQSTSSVNILFSGTSSRR